METSTWQAAHFFCPSTRDGIVLPNVMMTRNVKSRPKWIWFLQSLLHLHSKLWLLVVKKGRGGERKKKKKSAFLLNVAIKGLVNTPSLQLSFITYWNGFQNKALGIRQVFWFKAVLAFPQGNVASPGHFCSLRKKKKKYTTDLSSLLFTCLYCLLILSSTNYTCVWQYPLVTVGMQYYCNISLKAVSRESWSCCQQHKPLHLSPLIFTSE